MEANMSRQRAWSSSDMACQRSMSRLCWLGLGAGGSVGAGAGAGAVGGVPGGSAGGGAQSDAAAFSVDVPLFMFHYVDVTIIGENHFVNYFYSLCRILLKMELMGS